MPLTRNQQAALQTNSSHIVSTQSIHEHSSNAIPPVESVSVPANSSSEGNATHLASTHAKVPQSNVSPIHSEAERMVELRDTNSSLGKTTQATPDSLSTNTEQHHRYSLRKSHLVDQRKEHVTSPSYPLNRSRSRSLSKSAPHSDSPTQSISTFSGANRTPFVESNALQPKTDHGHVDLGLMEHAGVLRTPSDWIHYGQSVALQNDVFTQGVHPFGHSPLFSHFTSIPQQQNFSMPAMQQRNDNHQALHQAQQSVPSSRDATQAAVLAEQQRTGRRNLVDNHFMANLHAQISEQLSPGKHFSSGVPRDSASFPQTPAFADDTSPESRNHQASALGTAFSTPENATRLHGHQGRIYPDNMGFASIAHGELRKNISHHRTPGSAESSMSMDVENIENFSNSSVGIENTIDIFADQLA